MKYFGALRSDLKRLFCGSNFYLAWLSARGGIGAFLMAMTVAAVLPYGFCHREDLRHNYIHCLESRARGTAVGWAHVTAAAAGTFLAVFLGYLTCYGLLALRLPLITELELSQITDGRGYEGWFYYGRPLFYFLSVFISEGMGYAFLAVFALMVSARVRNAFLVLSAPVMLYYGSQFICGALQLPGIFHWYNVLRRGGLFAYYMEDGRLALLMTFLYFFSLICIEGLIFTRWAERRRKNG